MMGGEVGRALSVLETQCNASVKGARTCCGVREIPLANQKKNVGPNDSWVSERDLIVSPFTYRKRFVTRDLRCLSHKLLND